MSKIIDLTGQKFGRLTVLEYSHFDKQAQWLCKCDCGNKIIVGGSNLRRGNTKSCGCLQREKSTKDITGERHGRLLVLEQLNVDKRGEYRYNCLCDCGNKIIVVGSRLRSGNTKSCGCLSESFVAAELKKYFIKNYSALSEYRIVKNPKTGCYLPYDIYVSDNIFIEVQGKQHYEDIKWFSSNLIEQKYRDNIKRKYAKKNGLFIEVDLRKEKTVEEWIDYIENIINKYRNQ